MKSYNNHAAENETPRQQLREDADACDMPPATFRSFPALSVPASSRSKRRSNGRESRAATPSCRPCGRREASERRWCTSRASATCARVQDRSCTSRGSAAAAAGRRDSRQKKSLEEGRCTGSRIRVRSCPRKVTRNGKDFQSA